MNCGRAGLKAIKRLLIHLCFDATRFARRTSRYVARRLLLKQESCFRKYLELIARPYEKSSENLG